MKKKKIINYISINQNAMFSFLKNSRVVRDFPHTDRLNSHWWTLTSRKVFLKEVAQERSNLLHDQLLTAMESAIFWVEHVIRHRGAPHLKTAGIDSKWYQREMVDVIVFLLAVVTIMVFVICIALKKLWYILNHSENVITQKKKIQ